MSVGSRDSYESSFRRGSRGLFSEDTRARERARVNRRERIATSKARVNKARPRVKRDTSSVYDRELVKLKITKPAPGTKRIHVVLIDNSGSNRRIANHLKASSGYLTAFLKSIDSDSQIAFVYFSDHCDDDRIMQEVDFISPDEKGDKILHSSISHIHNADGGDPPEAIECALWAACDIDFGDAEEKHLYLVTDVVAHGMGMSGDDGCPLHRDWRESVKRVQRTFTSFEVVGCSPSRRIGEMQAKFLKDDRAKFDLIDLSKIREAEHRMAITGNALLFLIARHQGFQTVEMFLSLLYEKWLEDPVFGSETVQRAHEAIRRFGKYLEKPDDEVGDLMDRILV